MSHHDRGQNRRRSEAKEKCSSHTVAYMPSMYTHTSIILAHLHPSSSHFYPSSSHILPIILTPPPIILAHLHPASATPPPILTHSTNHPHTSSYHPHTPPPIILAHLQPSSSHTSTHHPCTHTIAYTHLSLTLYTTPPYSLTPSSPHPTHQVLSLFVQVHYAHVHDGADVCEALHDLHIATTLISCCAQLQKYKNHIIMMSPYYITMTYRMMMS